MGCNNEAVIGEVGGGQEELGAQRKGNEEIRLGGGVKVLMRGRKTWVEQDWGGEKWNEEKEDSTKRELRRGEGKRGIEIEEEKRIKRWGVEEDKKYNSQKN